MRGFLKKIFGSSFEPMADLSVLGVDLHSHLIPGIDDGAQSPEDSLEMIRALKELGFQKLITTPHIMSDAYPNTPEKILGLLEELRRLVKEEGIEIELEAAAEYYLDEAFQEMSKTDELLTFGGEKRYLLFETSYVDKPFALNTVIFNLNSQGYTPVLAHPERYSYLWDKELEDLIELKETGVLFQVNLASFAGSHSRRALRICDLLVQNDLIDFVGTDLHKMRQLDPIYHALKNSPLLNKVLMGESLKNKSLGEGVALS